MASLTRTQIQVLRMIAQGMSNQQIADARSTSIQAVVRTIGRAMQAIGADAEAEGNARVTAARKYMETAGIPSVDPEQ
jgi:DNA-binding NarL/FixJ family response regulator